MEQLCTGAVPLPAGGQALLGQHGQALAQPVEGVDGAGVVVDAGLAGVAVPVLAEPAHVQVEGVDRGRAGLDGLPRKVDKSVHILQFNENYSE